MGVLAELWAESAQERHSDASRSGGHVGYGAHSGCVGGCGGVGEARYRGDVS